MKRLLVLLWRMSKSDLRLLWFAIRHRDRPRWLLPATLGLGLYLLAPFNLAIPVLGAVDDFVLPPLVLHALLKLLPTHVIDGFSARHRLRTN
jgi:uncharacterized membrane protein YkvA (DUF1232 family)